MNSTGRQVIVALDTGDLSEALEIVKRLSPYVGAFKVGHGLVLPNGLTVVDRLMDAGAGRIFLDLKFHDIPNSVALAVREAARHNVWMMTLHTSGGPAMMSAALEEARGVDEDNPPLLVGVSVLTSIDEHTLRDHLGVSRSIEDHMLSLADLALSVGLDGLVCSALEIKALREKFGHRPVIVTPGIRLPGNDAQDQARVGDPRQAIEDGASYLVIGRALTAAPDLDVAIRSLGLTDG